MKKKLFALFFVALLPFTAFCGGKKDVIQKATLGDIEKLSQKKKLALYFSEDNSNALQVAIQEQNFPVALWFAENEICDVNHQNIYGRTAINDAIEVFDQEMLETLIEKGALIRREKYLQDPIIQTVELGNTDAAAYFTGLGIKYDFVLENGRNMIHVAAAHSQADIIPFLIEQGCKIDAQDNENLTPLLISIGNDDSDMLIALLDKGADIEKKSSEGQTPLFYAIGKFSNSCVQSLIDRKADIEKRDSNRRTPFLYAYEVDNESAAQSLIKSGATFPKGQLLAALKDQKYFYLDLLLDAGADITYTDSDDKNVLHIASSKSDYNSLRLFLRYPDSRSIVNSRDKNGNTPLLAACSAGTGFVNGASELLSAGATASITDRYGNNALHASLQNNTDGASKELMHLILSRDSSLLNSTNNQNKTPLIISFEHAKSECVSYLLDQRADVKVKDSSGNTALHYACQNTMVSHARTLVSRGSDVNGVNNRNETPLTIVAKKGNEDLADYFLNLSGIKIDIRDSSGKTARTYLWDLYLKKHDEASRRWDEYFAAKKKAQEAAADARKSKNEVEAKIRDLERQNSNLQAKINSADEGTNTSSWSNQITANNISITGYNISLTAWNIAINKNESAAREYGEKMDKEMEIQKSYTAKMKKLNGIPRQ